MRSPQVALAVVLTATPLLAESAFREELQAADADRSGSLDRQELVAFYRDHLSDTDSSNIESAAADFAEDALSWRCIDCWTLSLDEAEAFLTDREHRLRLSKVLEGRKQKIGWEGLGFSRFVVDAANPRPSKYTAPTVFSYRHDSEAEDKDQFSALGGVQLWSLARDVDAERLGTSQLSVTPGIDFDVDGSKAAPETTITVGLPIYYLRIFDRRFLESISVGLKPKFVTDRAFDREVVEAALTVTPTVPRLGAGFISPPKRRQAGDLSPISVFWLPSLELETGEVRDAAENSKLLPLQEEGTYIRTAPRLGIILYPWAISERLRFSVDYFHRFDLEENWDRGYGEARVDYDLVIDGLLEFSVIYRKGRKPPDFTKKDEILVGIGIRQ